MNAFASYVDMVWKMKSTSYEILVQTLSMEFLWFIGY